MSINLILNFITSCVKYFIRGCRTIIEWFYSIILNVGNAFIYLIGVRNWTFAWGDNLEERFFKGIIFFGCVYMITGLIPSVKDIIVAEKTRKVFGNMGKLLVSPHKALGVPLDSNIKSNVVVEKTVDSNIKIDSPIDESVDPTTFIETANDTGDFVLTVLVLIMLIFS